MKQETLEEVAEKYAEHQLTGIDDKFSKFECINDFTAGVKWQQEQDNTANDILNYILTNDDGFGIALGYNSREMIEQHFKNISYEKHTHITNR
jgi:hypothetical protein